MKKSEYLPLCIIHGWGFDCQVFRKLIDELEIQFEVIPIDLPGYVGKPIISEYSLTELARVTADRITRPSIILGWSMGGLIATELARDFADKVQSLILLCSTPCFAKKTDWSCAMPKSVLKSFIKSYNTQPQETLNKFTHLVADGSQHTRNWIRELKKHSSDKVDPQALKGGLRILLESDLRSDLAQLSLPMSMIFGERDSLVPAGVAKEINLLNSNIETTIIAKAGHTPFLSHPEQLAQLIRQHNAKICRN